MRVLFHFHLGFTGRRDYQSRGRAHSFLNLRYTTFVFVPSVRPSRFRCHRGFGHGKIAIWQFEAIAVVKLYDQWRNCSPFQKKCDFMRDFLEALEKYYSWILLRFWKIKYQDKLNISIKSLKIVKVESRRSKYRFRLKFCIFYSLLEMIVARCDGFYERCIILYFPLFLFSSRSWLP